MCGGDGELQWARELRESYAEEETCGSGAGGEGGASEGAARRECGRRSAAAEAGRLGRGHRWRIRR